jgi:hypothetical protein
MEALINELIEKAGLSKEQAERAVATTVHFVKSKLPAGLSDKVEGLMSGNLDLSSLFGGGATGGSPLDALKGMFGDNK